MMISCGLLLDTFILSFLFVNEQKRSKRLWGRIWLSKNYQHFVPRQEKVEGPCGNWYNQTFLESLNRWPCVWWTISLMWSHPIWQDDTIMRSYPGQNRHSELARPLFLQSDLGSALENMSMYRVPVELAERSTEKHFAGLRWERTPVEDLHRHRARDKASFHRWVGTFHTFKLIYQPKKWNVWADQHS